jgi:hypothetical protein
MFENIIKTIFEDASPVFSFYFLPSFALASLLPEPDVEVGTLRQIFGSNPLQITILIC